MLPAPEMHDVPVTFVVSARRAIAWCVAFLSKVHPVKAALGLACLVAAAFLFAPQVLFDQSDEAVTNAPVLPVWSPISGSLKAPDLAQGKRVDRGATLATIDNFRADNSALIDVIARLDAAQNRIRSLEGDIALLTPLRIQLTAENDAWLDKMRANLNLQRRQARNLADANNTRVRTRQADLVRYRKLVQKGFVSVQLVEQAEREYRAADGDRSNNELEVARIEQALTALNEHALQLFGEDRPKTRQQLDEITLRLKELSNSLAFQRAELADLQRERKARIEMLDRQSHAILTAPFDAVVWKTFVAHGSHVTPASELLEIANCDEIFISALFTQRHLKGIVVGQKVRAKVVGYSDWRTGRIYNFGGYYEGDSRVANAVNLRADKNAQIQVTVKLDEPLPECLIGARALVRIDR